ncbi:MAG: 2-oxo-tetronate isomerase [Desulfovibrio sp.]
MPRFAANLSMMFTEYPFEERFARAAKAGFTAVEYLFPYEYEPDVLAALLRENNLTQVLFNMPAGDWAAGERGYAALPGREDEFEKSIETALGYAKALQCPRVHMMAGIAPKNVLFETLEKTYKANMKKAADAFAPHGITLCLEAINQRSMPGYFLSTQGQGAAYIAESGLLNVKLQFDFFHVQMQEGCVALKFKEFFGIIGHCQLAGAPERHEPDTGELNYQYLFDLADSLGYAGYIGCEYNPAGHTEKGLGWFAGYAGK